MILKANIYEKNAQDMRFYIKRIWLIFGGLCAFVCLIFLFISLGWFGFMPSFHDLENPESYLASEVISSDQQILGTYYVQNRTNAEYADLSPNLIKALIATEDIRFYQHSGIDIWSLGRVFGKTIIGRNKSAGGGSTITQQLAKNLFPRKNQWKITLAFRKLKEWVIAIKLERNYTKEEIIAMYFNTVDFGNNSFGIKTAANTYFGKAPADLNLDEAAVLVGMLKAISYYSPTRNPENATLRRNVVLNQMRKADFITSEVYEETSKKPLDMSHFTQQDHQYGLATYFREYLRLWMLKWCENHEKA
ncbi:MAG: biosynthetic peptidoglycan transglycosylase, partial [Bacteroidales bacterium]